MPLRILTLAVAIAVLAFAATSLSSALPKAVSVPSAQVAGPRFEENYRLVSPETPGRGRDVPGLAVNPRNSNHIVEADVDYLNGECDYRVSFDAGRTWSGGHLEAKNSGENPPFPDPPCEQNFDSGGYAHFNATVVWGSGQNVYVAFSSHRGEFNRPEGGDPNNPDRENGAGDDSLVARSTDGGRTFKPAVVAVPGSTNPQPFSIRPQVAVEPGAGRSGQDRLYANAWQCHNKLRTGQTRLGGCSGGGGDRRMLVARSDDGGATWTDRVVASAQNVRSGADAANAASEDEQMREPSQPVIGPDGAVYIAWRNRDLTSGTTCPPNPLLKNSPRSDCIVVARSTDRGQTWKHFNTGVPLNGFVGHPRLAIDPARPSGVGSLYVAYQGNESRDPNIIVQASPTRGETWSNTGESPVPVNDSLPGNQSNPWVSVAPNNGRVNVVWHDQRHRYPSVTALTGQTATAQTANTDDIYYASSTDRGLKFSANRRVTDRSFNRDIGLRNVGSYTWYGPFIEPLPNGRSLLAWTDSREGDYNTGIQDIYLSGLNPAAPIGERRIATATTPGLSVALSRLAYPGGSEAVVTNPVTKVVVANQSDVGGALAGAVLARANYGPLLLSPADRLPANVKAEAKRMQPEGAFVIGDTSTLSPGVSRELRETTTEGREGSDIKRASPADGVPKEDRPADIARQIGELLKSPPPCSSPAPSSGCPKPLPTDTAVIVDPDTPEAVSASALAAGLRFPVLFVDNKRKTIPGPTNAALTSLGVKEAIIIGGQQAVNEDVAIELKSKVQTTKRLDGGNQYETSARVVTESKVRGLPTNVAYVADGNTDGNKPIDAAVLGAEVGRLSGLMLLSPSADGSFARTMLGADADRTDRLVFAQGRGGQDPSATAQDPGGPERTGGDPGRLDGAGPDRSRRTRPVSTSPSSASPRSPSASRGSGSPRNAGSPRSRGSRSRGGAGSSSASAPRASTGSSSSPPAASAPAARSAPAAEAAAPPAKSAPAKSAAARSARAAQRAAQAAAGPAGVVGAPSFPRAVGAQAPGQDGGPAWWLWVVLAIVVLGAAGAAVWARATGRRIWPFGARG